MFKSVMKRLFLAILSMLFGIQCIVGVGALASYFENPDGYTNIQIMRYDILIPGRIVGLMIGKAAYTTINFLNTPLLPQPKPIDKTKLEKE